MQPIIRAIVTGHSRGLGAAMTAQLLARSIPVLAAPAWQSGSHVTFSHAAAEAELDFGNVDALRTWLEGGTLQQFSRDADCVLLINNAGTLGPIGPAEIQPLHEIATTLQINVAAPLMLTAARTRAFRRVTHYPHFSGAAHALCRLVGLLRHQAALDHHACATAADGRTNLRICSPSRSASSTQKCQTLVRATPEVRFPMLRKFQRLHQEGHLTPPDTAAERIVALFALTRDLGRPRSRTCASFPPFPEILINAPANHDQRYPMLSPALDLSFLQNAHGGPATGKAKAASIATLTSAMHARGSGSTFESEQLAPGSVIALFE